MMIREILLKTVRCAKNQKTHTVQDIIQRLHKPKKGSSDQATHEYRCQDFLSGIECANCQYHQ